MRRVVVNFIILFLVLFPVLYAANYVVDGGLRKSRLDIYYHWTDIYSSNMKADVLLCGASRMSYMVSPKVMDSILHLDNYNMGMNGWTFNMQYARFKVYMQHNPKPKYVVQSVDYWTLNRRSDLYEYEQFFPYILDTILKKATDECTGRFTSREMYVPMFKYNNHMNLVAEGFNCYFNTGRQFVSQKYKGFENHKGSWNGVFDDVKKAHPDGISTPISDTTLAEFDEYLNYCRQNNIKVILEFAPVYYEGTLLEKNAQMIMDTYRKYAAKYDVPFLDYTHDTLCNDKKYFHDSQHMNEFGTQIFSVRLANDVKNIIDSAKWHYN